MFTGGGEEIGCGRGIGDGDAEGVLENGHAADELPPHAEEADGGEGAAVAGEEAAGDGGLAAGAEGDGAFGAEVRDAGDDRGALHDEIVQGVIEVVELGAEGGEAGRRGVCEGQGGGHGWGDTRAAACSG